MSYPQRNNRNSGRNNSNNNNNSKNQVKHSGAKHTVYFPKTGSNAGVEQHLTSGWKLSRNKELIAVKAVTTGKTKLSDKGWYGSVAVTFTNTVTGAKFFYWGTMHKATGKVIVSDVAMVINPKAPNGGYCGTYVRGN